MPNSKIIRTTPETQELSGWRAPSGTLGELTQNSFVRAAKLRAVGLAAGSREMKAPSFAVALGRGDCIAVIAEVKRASPSKGVINAALSAGDQAAACERGGAAALSVLTEPKRFGGRDSDLADARSRSQLPILKKDFHVAPEQLVQARDLGASAALIIVRAIEPARLAGLAHIARELELEILFEIRDEDELQRAIDAGAEIIGVNNRNLETLEMDRRTVARLVPLIPANCIAIAESGYSSRGDILEAAAVGADAVLIGSALSAANDPAAVLTAFADVPRRGRSARPS